MTETHLQIKAQFEEYLAENEKFENKGVKASAARARKALGELANLPRLVLLRFRRRKTHYEPYNLRSPGAY